MGSLPPWGGSGLKYFVCYAKLYHNWSPSLGREWIEIFYFHLIKRAIRSPSLGREWIEIIADVFPKESFDRLPPWGGSGLKCTYTHQICAKNIVSLLGEGVD